MALWETVGMKLRRPTIKDSTRNTRSGAGARRRAQQVAARAARQAAAKKARLWQTEGMDKAEPIVTLLIDKRITEGKCSLCDKPLDLGNAVDSAKEQEMKLRAAFGRHMVTQHKSEDASQAAARIVREATQD